MGASLLVVLNGLRALRDEEYLFSEPYDSDGHRALLDALDFELDRSIVDLKPLVQETAHLRRLIRSEMVCADRDVAAHRHQTARDRPHMQVMRSGHPGHSLDCLQLMAIYNAFDAPVLILGGGRVGRAAARGLREREVPYRIVERKPDLIRDPETYILGSAADRECLEAAGIQDAATVIVTTNDDATNIYLTVYCRRLRSDIQIVSRTTLERNVSTLHRAGADIVLSYASMGANAIYNVLERGDVVMLAEGLDVFRVPVPRSLAERTLAETRIRESTGCSVVAFEQDGISIINPPATEEVPSYPTAELILIGTKENEHRFFGRYPTGSL